MAAAREAEELHQASRQGSESPLADVSYDPKVGEADLRSVIDSPADEIVEVVVRDFAALPSEARNSLRASLTMDDFYTIMMYARRMAIRALRNRSAGSARLGTMSLALIEKSRVDWRDLAWAAGLLSFVVGEISGDARNVFAEAASFAEPDTSQLLARFAENPAHNLRDWGHRIYESIDGPGLLGDEGCAYAPSVDLVAVADHFRTGLSGEKWTIGQPTVGSSLPKVWLRASDLDVDGAIASLTGCALLRGHVAGESQEAKAQLMLIFLAEAASDEGAQNIALSAGPGPTSSFVGFGVASGRVCGVLVAESFIKGVEAWEKPETIERFRPPLLAALEAGH